MLIKVTSYHNHPIIFLCFSGLVVGLGGCVWQWLARSHASDGTIDLPREGSLNVSTFSKLPREGSLNVSTFSELPREGSLNVGTFSEYWADVFLTIFAISVGGLIACLVAPYSIILMVDTETRLLVCERRPPLMNY
jgi:hypothetical protein